MPGVLIIEAMAQTGGLLLLLEIPDRENKLLYFVAVDEARFRRPVVPGDQLRLEVKVLSWRGDFCKLEGNATVNGELAAEATLMCKMVDREPKPAAAQDGRTREGMSESLTFIRKPSVAPSAKLGPGVQSRRLRRRRRRRGAGRRLHCCTRTRWCTARRASAATMCFIRFARSAAIRRI